MKKLLLLWLAMLAIVLPLSAQNKAAMLQLTDPSKAEQAALNWFKDNSKGDVITSLDNLDSYTVLWVMIDRIGRAQNEYPAPLNDNIEKLKTWVKNGGNLIVTNQATDLVSTLGRVENFKPTIYGNGEGGNNHDTWGINAVTNDAKGHAIYKGLTTEMLNSNEAFPLIGSCYKWDHNSMWELNKFSYGNFESQTTAKCLGTWQQNTNLDIPAIIEFLPSGDYKGTILANGIAAFDWQASNRHANFEKLAGNMVAYMLTKNSFSGGGSTTEPTEPEVSVGTKVGMLKIESGISSTEQKAIAWFSNKYTADNVITSLDNLSDYKVLWAMIDRQGLAQGVSNLPLTSTQIETLKAWVKKGGNLLVTNHATQLVQAIGRYDKAIGVYGSGAQSEKADIWGINAVTEAAKNHVIYTGLTTSKYNGNDYFPLINAGLKWDHNCIWSGIDQNYFESTYNATCLGTWQQETSFAYTAVAEFNKTSDYAGKVLACGIGAYDWDATAYETNLEKFTANMLSYLDTGKADSSEGGSTEPGTGEGGSTTDPEVTVKVGMLKIESNISSTEQKAIEWFSTKYSASDVITSLENLSDYKVLWVMIDRPGLTQGVSNLPLSTEQIATLRAWVKSGGKLLVTNHATQLVEAIGRCNKAIDEYNSNSTPENNPDIWGINAIGTSNHEIYKNLSKIDSWFPLIKGGNKWNHNCIWKDVNQSEFESTYSAKCLGTWQQNNDFGWTAVAEFEPTTIYKGTVLACGIAAFDWDASPYKKNLKNFTANMLSYLATGKADPNPETIPQPQDGVIAKFDLSLSATNQVTDGATQKVYDVNHRLDAYETVGAKGKCLRFDGYSNYISYDINTDNMATKKLTFSLWCAPQAYPSITGMDASGEEWTNIAGNFSNNTGVAFRITNRGHYAFVCNVGGTLIECKATDRMPCSKWNHLVGIVNTEEGKVEFYNNGTLVASQTCTQGGDIDTGNSTFVIGKGVETVGSGTCIMNTFCGLIDEVELYNGLESSLITDITPENEVDMNYNIEKRYGNNILRPRFHGMPDGNWTNETHGLIYYGGKYHVFFQKNANGPIMCHQQWGHITSDNLYNWKEEKLALMPLEDYEAKGTWSGCVFTDPDFNKGKPVIGYTSVDFAKASISTAFSTDDNLLDWSKQGQAIAASPDGYADFRDCYYFNANGNKYMIVGTGKDGVGATTLHKYNNGSWKFQGTFFSGTDANAHGTYWEMPTITKMDEEGNYLFTCTPLGTSVGVKVIYWIGTINNDSTFNAVSGPFDFEMAGTSKDGYGLLSPSICQKDDKTICLGIVPDKVDGAKNAEWGWAHNYSLPRELSLSADKKSLVQKPYAGLTGMRSTEGNYSAENVALNNSAQALGNVKGRQIEFIGEFTVDNSAEQGFRFLKNVNNYASLSYKDGKLTFDISNMQKVANVSNYDKYVSDLNLSNGDKLKLHVYLDGSIADVFVNDKDAFSVRLFPTDANAVEVEAFSTGNTTVSSLKGWNLEVPKDVTLHVGSSCYASLYYSDRALVVPEKTKAYTYNVINDNLVVSHCYEPSQTIPAGVGVVVAAQADGDYTFALSTLAGTVDQYNKLRGSDVDATTVGGNVYYKLSLNANNDPGTIGFYWGAASGAAFTNKAHKAYLALTREGAATAKSFLLDGTTTGVDNVSVQKIVDAPLYNISGQRVGKSYKGIVISNGKKYIQK